MKQLIKICHITSVHQRYDTRIFYKECQTLAKYFQVNLIVNDEKEDEIINEVKIFSTNFSPKNRYQRMFVSIRKIKRLALEIDAEIYHLHDPELLRIVRFLKRKKKKVIFDSHEDYVSTIGIKEWIPKIFRRIILLFYKKYEERIVKKLDGAIACYHQTKERYDNYIENVDLVFNFPIITNHNPKISTISENKNVIGYAGQIAEQWSHHFLIQSFEYTKNNVKYLLAGSADEEYLRILKGHKRWSNVDFKGKIHFDNVIEEIYYKSSIGVALLDYIPQCQTTVGNLSNTKLFEYMFYKLPVICTDFDLWRNIVEGENCGILVNPRKPEEIAKAIDFLCDNSEKAKQMGENGHNAIISKYNWENDSKKLLKVYEEIIGFKIF